MLDSVPMGWIEMLWEFHDKYEHYRTKDLVPRIPPLEVQTLRRLLIEEEASEVCDAIDNNDMVQIADGLADLIYVAIGCALAYGIPLSDVFREVHLSNMTKSMMKDEKSIKGKTIKGPNYISPDIERILRYHGWRKNEQPNP